MIWLLLACTATEDSAPSECAHEPALTWANFGEAYMVQYCDACHASTLPAEKREGAPLGIDFDTYQGVLDFADRVAVRAVPDDADMPPGGGPSEGERANLAEWLDCQVAADLEALK